MFVFSKALRLLSDQFGFLIKLTQAKPSNIQIGMNQRTNDTVDLDVITLTIVLIPTGM